MATRIENHNSSGSGAAALGIVAVVGIAGIFAAVLAFLAFVLIGVTATGTVILAYKTYQLHVHKTIALAAIQANMPPPVLHAERRLPTARELTWGRDHA